MDHRNARPVRRASTQILVRRRVQNVNEACFGQSLVPRENLYAKVFAQTIVAAKTAQLENMPTPRAVARAQTVQQANAAFEYIVEDSVRTNQGTSV